MIKELSDQFDVLTMVHRSIDQMVDGLTDDQWLFRPNDKWNNIAAVIDHVTRVEKRFFAAIGGKTLDIDAGQPFKENQWNVQQIKEAWKNTLDEHKAILETVKESDLDQPGLTLRVGALNRRQLLTYAISHTTHHRGQIPLILKLM
ncbi:DinB family protein [Alicyclobacillus cycloheptanicus]|uniref:Damage-inducible protein DinB n=1 Tax=Alicyclobacillus cycloheptanicus TaxID=1457 RepID=A0ABT9XEG7_9BACL|nr:DinB family protein [Alicyclobacillus cycloheptanicus]MDQ0188525.1 putative damage-inducible protein DinB [Alicyclobacillus cycloheptanicus]WDM01211.1 DinB family protein [Alicyclobacillus cycloheptanicus]